MFPWKKERNRQKKHELCAKGKFILRRKEKFILWIFWIKEKLIWWMGTKGELDDPSLVFMKLL